MKPAAAAAPRLIALLVALAAAGCEFGPATPPPIDAASPPTGAPTVFAPAVRIDPTWSVQDDHWTFTGQIDPRGGATTVVALIGDDLTTPNAVDREVPVTDGLLASGRVSVELPTPDTTWLCIRLKATNEAGDGFSQPMCLRTDQAPGGAVTVTAAPSAEPSPD